MSVHPMSRFRARKLAAGLGVVSVMLVATAATAEEASLQDIAKAVQALPQIVIYQAKEIVTLDPVNPTAQAVAVVGDRVLAVGKLDELKAAAGKQPYTVNTTFADQVIVPGFIAQHDHPMLAALTMTNKIIAIENWVLPQGTAKAAKNRAEYNCEFATTVVGEYGGLGPGSSLMTALIAAAKQRGLCEMEGFVLAKNQPMLRLAARLGFSISPDLDDPPVRICRLPLADCQSV